MEIEWSALGTLKGHDQGPGGTRKDFIEKVTFELNLEGRQCFTE